MFKNNLFFQRLMAEQKEGKESKKPVVKKKAPLTKKKKVWMQLIAPPLFGRAVLGETVVEEPKKMIGKTIELSLMSLTGDMKKQNVYVTFAVQDIVDGKGQTQIVRYDVSPSSIKRVVRRGRGRVDASFICQTKDGKKIQIKPFFLTTHETKRSILTSLRKYATGCIATYCAAYDYETIMKDIISGKLQSGLRTALHKIYPIKTSEIRMLHLAKDITQPTILPVPNFDVENIMKPRQYAPRRQQTEAPVQQTRKEAAAEA